MYLLEKYKQHGLIWFLRRVMREFINPTTIVGRYLKPFSFLTYYFINKPVNFCYYIKNKTKKNSDRVLHFFYDINAESSLYHFTVALCLAHIHYQANDLTTFKIIIFPKQGDLSYEERSLFYSDLLPVTKLLAGKYEIILCSTRKEASFYESKAKNIYATQLDSKFQISQALSRSIQSSLMKAEPQAMKYVSSWLEQHAMDKKVLVITLSGSAQQDELDVWFDFANSVDQKKYFIVFIPDKDQVILDIPNRCHVNFFPPAYWNLFLRGALYQLAYLNLAIDTESMILCWLNAASRYIFFKNPSSKDPTEEMRLAVTPYQRWIFDEYNFKNVFNEFEKTCMSIEGY